MKLKAQTLGTFQFPPDYDVVRTAVLNKTDLTGGNNKFYVLEMHVSKDGQRFRLYSRYGRVGASGVEEERIPEQDPASLERAFNQLKAAKAGPRKGYVEVKLAQSKMGSSVGKGMVLSDDVRREKLTSVDDAKPVPKLDLHPTIERLVARLFEEAGQAVRNQLSGTLQTTTENPLGTLTLGQIEDGRKILQEVQQLLTAKPALKGSIATPVLDLSNRFYSAIPQTMDKRPRPVEGRQAMETWLRSMALNQETVLDAKEELLDLLSDVQGMVGGFATTDVDQKYQEIGCSYEFLDQDDPTYRHVANHMNSTRSRHHGWGSQVQNIWRVSVKGQKEKHLPTMREIGNVQPLFHGSGPQNILGICKHGLLMRPPGVYVTGSMFGASGLYFADQSSKSEQYAFNRFGGGSGRNNPSYFMFVTDVALGTIKRYQEAQPHLTKPPSGYHSVQGEKGRALLHNEFIVYSREQHLLQYLIEFKTDNRRGW